MKSNHLTSLVEEIYPRGTECSCFPPSAVLRLYLGEDAKCRDTIRALKFNNISLLTSGIIHSLPPFLISQHFQYQTPVLQKGDPIPMTNIKQPNSFRGQCKHLLINQYKQKLPNTFMHQKHPSHLAQNTL